MNELKRLTLFEDMLSDYKPSEEVQKLANSNRMVILAGVTSSGRNTIIDELAKTKKFHYLVSDTTRQPRMNDGVLEQDGHQYHFRSEEDFLKRLHLGLYLEASIVHKQQVSGLGIEELLTASVQHDIGITDTDFTGAANILEIAPATLTVFLIPPNFEEWMSRLTKRGKLDQAEIQRRLTSAEKELEGAIESDSFFILVNDKSVETARDIQNLAFGSETSQDIKANNKAGWALLNQLKGDLSS